MLTILPSRDAFRMEICGEGMPVHSLPKLKSGEGIPSFPSLGSTALSQWDKISKHKSSVAHNIMSNKQNIEYTIGLVL